eukprot:scaffold34890_cov54-Cyclotella_meneghiniana.AAC.3
MTNPDEMIIDAFGRIRIVTTIGETLDKQMWFQITETDNVIEGSYLLRDQAKLNRQDWVKMLGLCSIIGPKDSPSSFKRKRWEGFLNGLTVSTNGFEYQLAPKKINGTQAWFVLLGSKAKGGFNDAHKQIQSKTPCPVFNALVDVQAGLRQLLNQCIATNNRAESTNNSTINTNQLGSEATTTDTPETTNTNSNTTNVTDTSTDPALFKDIDVAKLNDNELSRLIYNASQEIKDRATKAAGVTKLKSWSFEMRNSGNHEYVCIPVPKQHNNTNAFTRYQTKYNAYVNEFCNAVGSGNAAVGAERLLGHLAANYSDLYVKCGREFGMEFAGTMDADSLAAMAVDSNLKQWQLNKVLKHVEAATQFKLSSVSVKVMEDMFSKDMVVPETGRYLYETVNDKGTTEVELVTYDYQSLVEVFKYIVSQKIMEHDIDIDTIFKVAIAPGGDHGLDAFRLNLKVLIVTEIDGEYEIIKDELEFQLYFAKRTRQKLFEIRSWIV